MLNRTQILMVATALICFVSGPIGAVEYSTDVTRFALISNPGGDFSQRGLLAFELPHDLTGKTIKSAFLKIPMSITITDSSLADLAVWPLGTTWTEGDVDWDNPWIQPGGDVADSSYVLFATDDGTSRIIEIDISTIVSAWAHEWYPNYGLMLTMIQDTHHFLEVETNGEWPQDVVARIVIEYDE